LNNPQKEILGAFISNLILTNQGYSDGDFLKDNNLLSNLLINRYLIE